MSSKHSPKIEAAVTECLDSCDPLKMPYSSVDKFIARLRSDPTWTDAEIIELQTRVIRSILARQGAMR